MLKPNPLAPPPRPAAPRSTGAPAGSPTAGRGAAFVSAEDFDATGILAGMDCCESRYWWVPELHAAAADPVAQATSRPASRPPAAV
jgi:hypothetical protein